MTTTEDAWYEQERWILDLRRRVDALEQRALTAPEPSADQRRLNNPVQIAECGGPCSEGGPAACDCGALAEPAPAADRPLWKVMRGAYASVRPLSVAEGYAAEIDAVADWLDARAVGVDAVVVLHAEARRTREGRDG